MVKRKQRDFQKTKLKVGRKVTKGGNITDTSFKTKKIIAPEQKFEALADKPLIELLANLNTKNASQKKETLHKIDKYIKENVDDLFLYFPDVLSRLGKVVLESDPELSNLAVKVISTCVNNLSEIQYKSFSANMMLHLKIMMSHGAMHVKMASLDLLAALVYAHPKILTEQTRLLFSLLNMISKEKNGKRTIVEFVSSKMTSATWHQTVLQHVRLFLQELINIEDKQVLMDEELKMTEKILRPDYGKVDMSWYSNELPSNEEDLKKFVKELLQVVCAFAKDASKSFQDGTSDGSMLSKSEAKHLNMVVQMMCYIGELASSKINFEEDREEFNLFLEIISPFMHGFPFEQQGKVDPNKTQELESYQLNMGICYLFTSFVLDSGDQTPLYAKMEEKMLSFLEYGFRGAARMSERSAKLILKFSRVIIRSRHIGIELKDAIITSVYDMLTQYRNTEYEEDIFRFLIEMCLDYQYKDALETEAMKTWFGTLITELVAMKESNKINKKLLGCIDQLCHRKNPEFVAVLKEHGVLDEKVRPILLDLLNYDNEEFQSTIIHIIRAAESIPDACLQALIDVVCSNSINLKVRLKLLWELHIRYSQSDVTKKDKLLFVKFLLNVACDMNYQIDPPSDDQHSRLFHLATTFFKNHNYRVYPTTKWGDHTPIFEVCLQYLLTYCGDRTIDRGILLFAQAFVCYFKREQFIPSHTLIAFLSILQKINRPLGVEVISQHCYLLYFAAFLFMSMVLTDAPEEVVPYSVAELSHLLVEFCDVRAATTFVTYHQRNVRAYQEEELYHFMRTVVFLKNHKRIMGDNYYLNEFFHEIELRVQQSPVLVPVWRAMFT